MIKLCAFADEAEESLVGQISALKRNKIEYLELRSIAGKNVKDFTIDEAKEYQRILSENGIKVWSIGSPLGKTDIDCDFKQYENVVRHVYKLANVFETKRIRMFSFFNAYEKKEKVFLYLNRMVELASEYGVLLCHENEKEVYGDTLERVLELKENVKGLAFVYDPANYLQVGEKAEETLDKVHAISEYYHIKDVIVATDELVPAGEGDGKIKEIIERVQGDTVLTLEPHLKTFAGYAAIDNTVMKNKYSFKDGNQAFDAAVKALEKVLRQANYAYTEEKGGFIKVAD